MDLRPSSIVKLGGSLLGLPDLRPRLRNFLGDFSRPRSILVCGGGNLVDEVRRWDRIYGLGEEPSHWISLRLLSVTSRVLARLAPSTLELVDSPEGCPPAWERSLVPVYDPYHFIADLDESDLSPLPRRWRVTSDSIAARMAVRFGARELVLLESVSLPERISIVEAAERGIVDPHFPTAARGIERVVAVNLRADASLETILFDPEVGVDS